MESSAGDTNNDAADRLGPSPADGSAEWVERACPVCRKKFRVRRDKLQDRSVSFYPFCSQRCRMVDLGRWLDADYRLHTPSDSPDDLEDEEQ